METFDKKEYPEEYKRLANILIGIRKRCYQKSKKHYANYGGRGITMCDEWRGKNSRNNFFQWAMNNGYEQDLTIDRIDGDGNYEPSNCRWVDRRTQANNTRRNVNVTVDGVTKTVSEWARENDIGVSTIFERIYSGWSHEKAVTTPVRKKKK